MFQSVTNIHIIGRRGIENASFSNRELREFLNLEDCNFNIFLNGKNEFFYYY